MKSSRVSHLRYHKMKRPPLTKSERTAHALTFILCAFEPQDLVRSWSFSPCGRCSETLVSVCLRRNGSLLFTFCPACNSLLVNYANPAIPPAGSPSVSLSTREPTPVALPLTSDITSFLRSLCNPPSSSSVP